MTEDAKVPDASPSVQLDLDKSVRIHFGSTGDREEIKEIDLKYYSQDVIDSFNQVFTHLKKEIKSVKQDNVKKNDGQEDDDKEIELKEIESKECISYKLLYLYLYI